MIRRPPRSTLDRSSAASDVYKRQILVIMFNANVLSAILGAILSFVPSLRPVLRTAIAYPLSSRFRTGMTMVLFAMIMATVVVMAVVISTTQSLTRLDERQTAGFDIQVSPTLLSFFNPCLLYTSDAADERSSVDLGGRRIIKKKKTDWQK